MSNSKKKDLTKILSLGYLPPVNNYYSINSNKNEEIFFPAELMYSKSSKLVQLSTIVDKEIIFQKAILTPAALRRFYGKTLKNFTWKVRKCLT